MEVTFNTSKKLRYIDDGTDFPEWVSTVVHSEFINISFIQDGYKRRFASTSSSDSNGNFPENALPTIIVPIFDSDIRELTLITKYLENDSTYSNIKNVRITLSYYGKDDVVLTAPSLLRYDYLGTWGNSAYQKTRIYKHYFFDLNHEIQKIKIEILSTEEANKKARLDDFEGTFYTQLYNSISKFMSFEIYENLNVLSDDVAVNTCNFTAKLDDYMAERIQNVREFDVNHNGKYYGRFFITDCQQTAKNIFEITAEDMKGKAKKYLYDKWAHDYPEICLADIYEACNVGIDSGNSNLNSLNGWIKVDSCLYGLCQIAWALNKMIDSSRASFITLRDIPTEITSFIDNYNGRKKIIGDAKFTKSETFTQARYELKDYQTVKSDSVVLETVYGDFVKDSKYYFADPPCAIAEGFSDDQVKNFGGYRDNYTILRAVDGVPYSNRTVPLHGSKMTPMVYNITVLNEASFAANATTNEKVFDRFTVAQGWPSPTDQKSPYIKKFIESPGTVSAKIVVENERIGDLVQIETAFSGTFTGIITSMVLHLGYTDVADIEIRVWPYEGGLG